MSNLLSVAATLFFLAGTPSASGADETVSADAKDGPSQKQSSQKDMTEIKCRRVAVLGSLVRKVRVCKTLAEWENDSERSRDAANKAIDNSNFFGNNTDGGGI